MKTEGPVQMHLRRVAVVNALVHADSPQSKADSPHLAGDSPQSSPQLVGDSPQLQPNSPQLDRLAALAPESRGLLPLAGQIGRAHV